MKLKFYNERKRIPVGHISWRAFESAIHLLDRRLIWQKHIFDKTKEFVLKSRKLLVDWKRLFSVNGRNCLRIKNSQVRPTVFNCGEQLVTL